MPPTWVVAISNLATGVSEGCSAVDEIEAVNTDYIDLAVAERGTRAIPVT
jgi:hypothetical protein